MHNSFEPQTILNQSKIKLRITKSKTAECHENYTSFFCAQMMFSGPDMKFQRSDSHEVVRPFPVRKRESSLFCFGE